MAMTNPELAKLYGYDINNITRADFAKFMEDVYKYVTPNELYNAVDEKDAWKVFGNEIPSSFGITSLSNFAKGLENYAKSKGINLKANWSNEKPTFENAVSYIKEGLKKDSPVALINMFDSVNMQYTNPKTSNTYTTEFKQHWVTITGIIENRKTGEVTLEVSTWGGKATLNFNEVWDHDWTSVGFPAGIVYFEPRK